MKNKKRNIAKMALGFGFTGLLVGLGMLFIGETLIGISSSSAGVLLMLIGFKTINDIKDTK